MRTNAAARLVLLLLVGGLMVLTTAACSTEPQAGGCVRRDGTGYASSECTAGALRVLAVHTDTADRCTDVPGVTNSWYGDGSGGLLCLGPLNADPASAVNTARTGDCLTDTGTTTVRTVRCTDRSAAWRVLARKDRAGAPSLESCPDVPGTTSTYTWSLQDDTPLGRAVGKIGADILFCLGPAGVDPATSVDLARPGDCLRETGSEPSVARVDCGSAQAGYRVTRRVDNALFLDGGSVCDGQASVKQSRGTTAYVLCLASR